MARARKQLDFRALSEALIEGSSMSDVARRLGLAKPTLYRMSGSREELISLAIDAEAERLLEHVHHEGLRGVFGFASDSPAGFALLFGDRYPEARQAMRRVENRLQLELGRDTPDLAAAGLLGMVAGIARRTIEDGQPADAERLGSDFDAVAKLAARISDPGA